MALTRITKGVIKPNENYDTHNINSTGIVTAIGLDVNGNGDISGNLSVGGVLTYEDVTSIDSVGIITAQKDIHVGAGLSVVGVSTFTETVNFDKIGTSIFMADSLVHIGNSGTKLQFHVNAAELHTSGYQRLQINSGGNLIFKSPNNNTGEQPASLRWINENNAGDMGKISLIREAVSQAPAALAFYTSPNVDTSANSGRGDITERLRITSRGDMRFGSSSIANKINSLDYILTFTGRGGGGAGAIAFRDVNGNDDAFINVENASVFITADPANATADSSIRFRVDGSNERLNITPSGINVSGIVTATGADINGDLDVDGHTNLDNVNIAGITTGTIFKVPDATNVSGATNHIAVGDNSDLKLYHDNNGDAQIFNSTGHLTIVNNTSGKIINLQPKSGANGIIARYEGAAELYHNGIERVATTSAGAQVTGTFAELQFNCLNGTGNQYKFRASGTNSKGFELIDVTLNQRAYLYHNSTYLGGVHHFHTDGTLRLAVEQGHIRVKQDNSRLQIGAGNDLTLYHDSTNSFIENITGQLSINNSGGNISIRATDSNGDFILRVGGSTASENAIVAVHHGEVILSCNGATKLTTTTTGITVTGNINATGGQLTLENGNEEQIHRFWTSGTDSDINGLLQNYASSSTFGTVVEGAHNGHHVIALRDNDNHDSFAIISGGSNYQSDTTYDKIIARFKADGKIIFGGNTTNENVTLEILPGGTAGNYSQLVLGRTSSAPAVQTTAVVKGGNAISGVPGIIFGSSNTNLPCVSVETPNSTNGHIVFKPKGSEKLRIESDGTIIMGDAGSISGSGVLHLYQASNDPYILIQRGVGDTGIDLGGLYFKNNTNSQAMIKAYQASVNTANLHFYVNYLGNFADRFLMESTGTFAIQGNITDEKLVLSGSTNPYIRFREGNTNKAYIQWNSGGLLQLNNQEDGSVLRIKDGLDFSKDGSTYYNVHHSDNSSDWGENYTNYFVGTSGASTSVRDTEKVRFYKVTIYGVRNYAGGNDVRIMRAGVHTDNGIHGMWVGSMDVQIKFRPSNCGNGANYSRVVHNYHSNTSSVTQGQGGGNIAKIRDYISCSESGALYVWLRGQLSYQITVNGRPATVASIDMNDYVTSMDSSIMPSGYDAESRDALSIYFGYQGQSGAGRKLYGTSGGVEAQGNVSATGSKPFKIPHPLVGLSTTKNLVHAAIEGPQCDNIYRGKTTLVSGISTVNIDTNAGMSEGTFATLNRDIQCFTTNETGWTPIKGSVSGNKLTIIAQDNSCTDTISWMVVGERQDDNIINNTMTDSEGHLIVEPDFEQIEEPDNPGNFSPNTSQIDENGVDQTFVQPLSS